MHELSLADAILEIALRQADGRRITRVHTEVGTLRQAVPSALAFSFEVIANGTMAQGAALEIHPIAARGKCRRCRIVSELHGFPLQCLSCGGFDLDIVTGEELIVASLELERSG